VQEICKATAVRAHSMRGLHSTLARGAGVTGHVVAASLGHERVSTTIESYAKLEAVVGARSGAR
jgi:integrase